MNTERGTITGLFQNGKTFSVYIDNDKSRKYSGFNNFQNNAQKGDTVSFQWEAGGDQGQYRNIKTKLAVEATTNAAPAPANNVAAMPGAAPVVERNGMQVGAAINQAIAMGLTEMSDIENAAEQLLLIGDRLAAYRVHYKDEVRKNQKADVEGLEAIKESA